ncbi:rhodanese-like domain-containing protein [Breoghania sp. JC706]|uniref:rhodanese-like domain-containing protein n=1 Tax=Breoghania sp. JC706 TaxID=3117732 RepID=UPI00300B0415
MKTETVSGVELQVLTPEEVKERLDRDEIVLIDVRTPAEYSFEHIAGAMLFPMSSFDPGKLPVQTGKPIVFHCGSGIRSKAIADRCAQAGIAPLAHMGGGFNAWKAAKLPYSAIDPATGAVVPR